MQNNMYVTINNQYFAIRLIKNTIILQYISAIHTYSTVIVISLHVYIYIYYSLLYYTTTPNPEISLNVLFATLALYGTLLY
jgi:hypothetical protein